MKACQRNWAEVFGDEGNMFAVSASNSYQKVRLQTTSCPETPHTKQVCPDALVTQKAVQVQSRALVLFKGQSRSARRG